MAIASHGMRPSSPPRQQSARRLRPCAGRRGHVGAGDPALALAMSWQWVWIDPLVGIIGSARHRGLGLRPDPRFRRGAARRRPRRGRRERRSASAWKPDGDRITDLHLWQIGPGHRAAVVSIVSDRPQPPAVYNSRLADVPRLSHVTVEVAAVYAGLDRRRSQPRKKGRRQADGPSLGRKRPRRAAEDRAEARYRAAAICSRAAQNARAPVLSSRMAVNNRHAGLRSGLSGSPGCRNRP